MSSYIRFDGMTWPDPSDPEEISYQLTWGDAESVRLIAASYVRAYAALVEMPQRRRATIIRELRKRLTDTGAVD